ncbi:MAG TPA: hypothetical protein VFG44_04090 [Burkholderiales bacterium]|nr:hypothetical protein [Burkholderiales bacterium]
MAATTRESALIRARMSRSCPMTSAARTWQSELAQVIDCIEQVVAAVTVRSHWAYAIAGWRRWRGACAKCMHVHA